MARSVVVLPQPDWPRKTMNSLSFDGEIHVLDDVDKAEMLVGCRRSSISVMAAPMHGVAETETGPVSSSSITFFSGADVDGDMKPTSPISMMVTE
jgi:hypothetical protein